jgi:hypothetical protein
MVPPCCLELWRWICRCSIRQFEKPAIPLSKMEHCKTIRRDYDCTLAISLNSSNYELIGSFDGLKDIARDKNTFKIRYTIIQWCKDDACDTILLINWISKSKKFIAINHLKMLTLLRLLANVFDGEAKSYQHLSRLQVFTTVKAGLLNILCTLP